MEPTFWAALVGAAAAGAFALVGVSLSNHHSAKERAADRQHEIALEREGRVVAERAIRRELALSAMQQFSAQGEHVIRQLELARSPSGAIELEIGKLKDELEDSVVALELVASEESLMAAQKLVRMLRPWFVDYIKPNSDEEWHALGVFRNACRRDLFDDFE